MHTYRDLINADGSYNLAAIMQIALRKARTERNAYICDAAGVSFAKALGLSLGDAAAFYAANAAKIEAPANVGSFSKFLAAQLRDVWATARSTKACREEQRPAVKLARAA